MPGRIVNKAFPEGYSCPQCGRKLKILYWTDTYKEAVCTLQKGHCGWWGYTDHTH